MLCMTFEVLTAMSVLKEPATTVWTLEDLKMEAAGTSKILILTYQTRQRHIQETATVMMPFLGCVILVTNFNAFVQVQVEWNFYHN
jgi:hypothetical protein